MFLDKTNPFYSYKNRLFENFHSNKVPIDEFQKNPKAD